MVSDRLLIGCVNALGSELLRIVPEKEIQKESRAQVVALHAWLLALLKVVESRNLDESLVEVARCRMLLATSRATKAVVRQSESNLARLISCSSDDDFILAIAEDYLKPTIKVHLRTLRTLRTLQEEDAKGVSPGQVAVLIAYQNRFLRALLDSLISYFGEIPGHTETCRTWRKIGFEVGSWVSREGIGTDYLRFANDGGLVESIEQAQMKLVKRKKRFSNWIGKPENIIKTSAIEGNHDGLSFLRMVLSTPC